MLKNLQKRNEGFTIVEVMIVLAIAGLIILVVLLAVPALQRNSRNTAIRSDASAVAGGINEYTSNNDGAIPTAASGTGTVNITGTGTGTSAKVGGGTAVTTVTATPTTLATGAIQVRFGIKCDGTTSTRSAAVFYSVENSGSATQIKCVEA